MVHNKRECGAKKRAIKLGIPHVHIKSVDEEEIIKLFQAWRVDLIVLAGWMRIVSPKLIDAFPNRIINIHPSLLPKHKGLNAVQQALDAGDVVSGCTVHYVTEELDSGKIIEQSLVSIFSDDTVDTLTQRVQQAEHRLLPMVIDNLIKRS
jgi:formyltetrahydrofolate-dependent phosphoribosylglycinamide formyltransferase